MKRIIIITITFVVLLLFLASCAPVLNREYMNQGSRKVSFRELRQDPERNKGKLYILGGLIVETKLTDKGSQIEAVHVPVDSYGYLDESEHSQGRFLATLSKEKGTLDPVVYGRNREITLAGEFTGIRAGKIDEMEYAYPVFEIKQIYLWSERREYYYVPYDPWFYPWYYPYPFFWDPWWRYYPPPPPASPPPTWRRGFSTPFPQPEKK